MRKDKFIKPKLVVEDRTSDVTFSGISIGDTFKVVGDLRTFIKIRGVRLEIGGCNTHRNCVILTSSADSEGDLTHFSNNVIVTPAIVTVEVSST